MPNVLCFHPPDYIKWFPLPYLWVLFRQVTSFAPDQAVFVLPQDYVVDPANLPGPPRLEGTEAFAAKHGYVVPTRDDIIRSRLYTFPGMPHNVHAGSLSQLQSHLIREVHPPFQAAIAEAFETAVAAGRPDAVLTWVNNPSMEALAARHGLPVIHNEMAALRPPTYRSMAFHDYSGVNGNTGAHKAYVDFLRQGGFDAVPWYDYEELHRLFMARPEEAPPMPASRRTGIAFQLENDTNTIAFSNGWSMVDLVNLALRMSGSFLLRYHPSQLTRLKDDVLPVDSSPSPLTFLEQCSDLVTINSSMAFEAALFGRGVTILGDSPYRILQDESLLNWTDANRHVARLKMLNWFLFGYLVPYEITYDGDYLDFRLASPSAEAIYRHHHDLIVATPIQSPRE